MNGTNTLAWFKLPTALITQPKFQRLSAEAQAGFITLCCVYWQDGAVMTIDDAKANAEGVDELIDRGYIQEDEGLIRVEFLDEQMQECEHKNEQRRAAGRKSAQARAKQKLNEKSTTVERPLNECSTDKIRVDKSRVEEKEKKEKKERERDKRADAPPLSGDVLVSGNLEKPNTHTPEPQEKEKVAPKRKVFSPPTIEDLREFFGEVNMIYEADKFFDYYTANGWMVGKVKMKDWKATARNWARRKQEYSQSKPQSNGKPFADLTPERFYDSIDQHLEKKRQNRANGYG